MRKSLLTNASKIVYLSDKALTEAEIIVSAKVRKCLVDISEVVPKTREAWCTNRRSRSLLIQYVHGRFAPKSDPTRRSHIFKHCFRTYLAKNRLDIGMSCAG